MQSQILRLVNYPTMIIILLSYFIHLILLFLLQMILPIYEQFFGVIGGADFQESSLLVEFITIGILGPIIESILSQLIPIYLLSLIKKLPLWSIILISAVGFALMHNYSWLYIVYSFFIGILYATTFLICKIKRGYSLAFRSVCLIHSLYNITVFSFDQIFN